MTQPLHPEAATPHQQDLPEPLVHVVLDASSNEAPPHPDANTGKK
ncbi:hypothetical protein LMG29542_08610 [Paraburkholderia humisilvae]|uniref:Uncharacterized protein n=3 Tax=Paraburkholderia humisilvae TaxID=627669 RepID=A0A6J5F8L2_9BURK|nr:hypothetical protein LMG29542_08610 [Paraburkholderia humisilvae]